MEIAELADRRIAILGAGREGQAAYAWLRRRLPSTRLSVIAEAAADPGFKASLAQGDQLLIEPLTRERLQTFEILVRSPGISMYREPVQAAMATGVRVTSPSNLWFAAHPQARTICVTGTKGKSTTSALVAHLLRSCGCAVQLAGNIGIPLLACDDRDVDWWVIELSSYQIADLEASPTIALFLNLSPEHLDWHGNEANYRRDKLRLAALASRGLVLVNAADAGLAGHFQSAANAVWFNAACGVHIDAGKFWYRQQELPLHMPAGLPGRHNLYNTAAALSVSALAGINLLQAAGAVASFESLPHRLQPLGQREGIYYINDSIATTPVATVAALEALQDKKIVLLVGGFDRGLDWTPYGSDFLNWPPRAVIGLPENGPRIIESLCRADLSPPAGFHPMPDMSSAVARARELAAPGDTILLSPGAPSFPQFVDFRDRGQQFARLCGFNPESPSGDTPRLEKQVE
ncbi:MAG TPA: UDP-N-acetylmuramoyl-L-alanine--D-glutamate ligase [Xanthomonadales bacterium]|nr:UDP-N-acetylmuramoyl-L-alanine--D-glutamate ligase [Xanthomonadales bacterium]